MPASRPSCSAGALASRISTRSFAPRSPGTSTAQRNLDARNEFRDRPLCERRPARGLATAAGIAGASVMTMVDTEEVAARPLPAVAAKRNPPAPVRVQGKFFFVGDKKHFVKGVTYGPFPKGSHEAQFPEYMVVDSDFAMMAEAGINTVRVFTVPP